MTKSRKGPARTPAGSRTQRATPQSRVPVASSGAAIRQPQTTARSDGIRELQGLTATALFDSGNAAKPYSATVRFTGQRRNVGGRPKRGDAFSQDEVIEGVIPASGLISVTTRVFGVNPGEWNVAAELVATATDVGRSPSRGQSAAGDHRALQAASWSWHRWALSPRSAQPLRTRWARLTGFDAMPAVIPGSWAGLVALGVVLGFVFQGALLPRQNLAVGTVLPISLLAAVSGVIGGKVWYIALNLRTWRQTPQDGFCIQGALVGATAVGTLAVTLLHLPIGVLLDTTAPGLFVGVAVGRLGCFFTGCCAGRPTASRFGVWCSDRRVGARRIPTQLLESLAAFCIGIVGCFLVLRYRLAVPGAVFIGSMAAYTLCRQFILRLRIEARRSGWGARVSAIGAAIVFSGSVAWFVVGVR